MSSTSVLLVYVVDVVLGDGLLFELITIHVRLSLFGQYLQVCHEPYLAFYVRRSSCWLHSFLCSTRSLKAFTTDERLNRGRCRKGGFSFLCVKKLSFQLKCIEKREWSNVMQRLSSKEKASFSKSKKHSRRRPYLKASRRSHWSGVVKKRSLKATWALNNNKTQVKLSSKQQISSQQCTAALCKKVLSSWAVIRLSSAAD